MIPLNEVFAARLFAATFYLQHGWPASPATIAAARGIDAIEAQGATHSINYNALTARMVKNRGDHRNRWSA